MLREPVVKRQTLYDSTYMRYLSSKIHRNKVERWLPKSQHGENGELSFNGYRVSIKEDKSSVDPFIAQQCEYTQHRLAVYLKMVELVNFMWFLF